MRQLSLLQESKKDRKKEYYRRILEKCKERILSYSASNKFLCLYHVPVYVVGWPLYNWERAASYIVKKLRRDGFEAYRLHDNVIYVCWETVRSSKSQGQDQDQDRDQDQDQDQDFGFLDDLAVKYRPS